MDMDRLKKMNIYQIAQLVVCTGRDGEQKNRTRT